MAKKSSRRSQRARSTRQPSATSTHPSTDNNSSGPSSSATHPSADNNSSGPSSSATHPSTDNNSSGPSSSAIETSHSEAPSPFDKLEDHFQVFETILKGQAEALGQLYEEDHPTIQLFRLTCKLGSFRRLNENTEGLLQKLFRSFISLSKDLSADLQIIVQTAIQDSQECRELRSIKVPQNIVSREDHSKKIIDPDKINPAKEIAFVKELQHAIDMARDKNAANARQRDITNAFFGQHPPKKGCNCTSCRQHPLNQIRGNQGAAQEPIKNTEEMESFVQQMRNSYPKQAEKLFAQFGSDGRKAWDALGEMAAGEIRNGNDAFALAAMRAVQSFVAQVPNKEAISKSADQSEIKVSFDSNNQEEIGSIVNILFVGLSMIAEVEHRKLDQASADQVNILNDKDRSDHEHNIASLEKQRLVVESKMVDMRLLTTQARLSNAETDFGCNNEKFAEIMFQHLKLPGGIVEDPCDLVGQLGLDNIQTMDKIPISDRQVMNEAVKLIDFMPSPELPATKPTNETKHEKTEKKRGKQTSGAAQAEASSSKQPQTVEGEKGKGKAKAPESDSEVDKEGTKGFDIIRGFFDHEQDMKHFDALAEVLKRRLDLDAKRKENQAHLAAGELATTPLPPLPKQITFDKKIIPPGLFPVKILQSIHDFDFLLDEIRKEAQEIYDIRCKIQLSIHTWSLKVEDTVWSANYGRLLELPLMREHKKLRLTLTEDAMNAFSENVKIVKYILAAKKEGREFPPEIYQQLTANGRTEAKVRRHWIRFMGRGFPSSDRILYDLDIVRDIALHPTPQDIINQQEKEEKKRRPMPVEEDGKEWWKYVMEHREPK